MPSASCVVTGTETSSPASHDRAYAGAPADTTPITLVVSPSASRAASVAQMPDPSPIGT